MREADTVIRDVVASYRERALQLLIEDGMPDFLLRIDVSATPAETDRHASAAPSSGVATGERPGP